MSDLVVNPEDRFSQNEAHLKKAKHEETNLFKEKSIDLGSKSLPEAGEQWFTDHLPDL